MTNRLPDWELEYIENTIANSLRIQQIIKGLVYDIDDPEQLEKLVQLAATAARVRSDSIKHMDRRKAE